MPCSVFGAGGGMNGEDSAIQQFVDPVPRILGRQATDLLQNKFPVVGSNHGGLGKYVAQSQLAFDLAQVCRQPESVIDLGNPDLQVADTLVENLLLGVFLQLL